MFLHPVNSSQVYSYLNLNKNKFLKCQQFINGDQKSIQKYVKNGRLVINEHEISETAMSCESIKFRIHGNVTTFGTMKRKVAFARNIYQFYELQEAFLSISYHPDYLFCYVIDSKASETLKTKMRMLESCFPNVFVMKKEYDFDSEGHNQDRAHIDCLQFIKDKQWNHVILLQSSDLVIKSQHQISKVSHILNSTSAMGFSLGFKKRYNTSADWTPAGLKLFQNESGVSSEILHRPLIIRKFSNHVILSRVFIDSIFSKLNLNKLLDLIDDKKRYGIDEMFFQTLYGNYLGLDGQMESNCSQYHNDTLTRVVFWDFTGRNKYDKDCKSKLKRHNLCILGVEYLRKLANSPSVIANKVMSNFDFGTVLCVKEMVRNGKTGKIMNEKQMMRFPQFREMKLKKNGKYNSSSFIC